jgi:desulfoferrodoxin (superoxide reductase-like protein)
MCLVKEATGAGLTVRVGAFYPMEEKHYIEWVEGNSG